MCLSKLVLRIIGADRINPIVFITDFWTGGMAIIIEDMTWNVDIKIFLLGQNTHIARNRPKQTVAECQ
jgi:hypothetical protein